MSKWDERTLCTGIDYAVIPSQGYETVCRPPERAVPLGDQQSLKDKQGDAYCDRRRYQRARQSLRERRSSEAPVSACVSEALAV